MTEKRSKPGKRRESPKARKMTLPDQKTFQPNKAEMEEEFDMPGATEKEVRSAFFRPFLFQRKSDD